MLLVREMNSQIFFLAGLTLLHFFATSAHADSDTALDTSGTASTGKHGKRGGSKSKSESTNHSNSIIASCAIVPSPSNPVGGPCVSLVIILKDAEGKEVYKNRTTPQGQIDFTAEPGKSYTVTSGSRYYEVIAPKGPVRAGSKIVINLQQK